MKKRTTDEVSDFPDVESSTNENKMARADLYKISKYGSKLHDMLKDSDVHLEEWQRSKITRASDYLSAVYHSLDYELSKESGLSITDITVESAFRPLDTSDEYKATLYSKLAENTARSSTQRPCDIPINYGKGKRKRK